eukprot:2555937-Amphidinium_carterae.1
MFGGFDRFWGSRPEQPRFAFAACLAVGSVEWHTTKEVDNSVPRSLTPVNDLKQPRGLAQYSACPTIATKRCISLLT